MERVGFIGGYDKIDLILYTAKILSELGKRVLVVDTTITQKAKYVVPAINPKNYYITTFENIDIAVGFRSIKQLTEYGEKDNASYDFILVDIDNNKTINEDKLNNTEKNYFVTAFDTYSLKKGVEILDNLQQPLQVTKLLFERNMTKEDDEYLNFLSLGKKISWNEDIIYFPIENGDSLVIAENQRLEKIKFNKLSNQYKDGIAYLVNNITNENERKIRKAMKKLG